MKRIIFIFISLLAVVFVAACSSSKDKSTSTPSGTSSGGNTPTSGTAQPTSGEHVTLNLAYYPNITHAPGLVGVSRGTFARSSGQALT